MSILQKKLSEFTNLYIFPIAVYGNVLNWLGETQTDNYGTRIKLEVQNVLK